MITFMNQDVNLVLSNQNKMYTHNINPVLLNLGPVEIRYYGLVYVLGFIFTFFYLKHLIKNKKIKLTKDQLYDYLLYLILAVLIGGRFFHVFVYNFSYYLTHPELIFAIWRGGMSFHGALIGVIFATYLFTKKKTVKSTFYELADRIVIPTSLLLCLGRIVNFINGELFGTPTNLPWGVRFPDPKGGHFPDFRHPSQIYESIKNLFIFFILLAETKIKKRKPGLIFWTFIFLYGTLRFMIEFVRFSYIHYLGLSIGQYLCIMMIIPSAYILIKYYIKPR